MDSLDARLDNLIEKADKMNRFIVFLLEEREEMNQIIVQLKVENESLQNEREELTQGLKSKQAVNASQNAEIKQSIDSYIQSIERCLNKFGE